MGLTSQRPVNLLLMLFIAHFCLPDCGNVLLDAYAACGNDFQRSTIVSLCSSNENGNFCYELHVENLALINNARSCSTRPDQCDYLQLSEGVTRQGCCISVLHDVYKSMGVFGPLEEAYGDCSITLSETRCNNGPLRESSSPPSQPTRPTTRPTAHPPTPPPTGSDDLPRASAVTVVVLLALVFIQIIVM